ncbi:DNA adenine methylase [Arthrobacter oryzae]|uniref:DNA adenine methylase n=1 Tax=Arthrobacter oryzae TaxID=409290 RepID=UPI0027802F20|nr:DNA adenine methylase [Arthrobacter oryzae]MDQ0078253.1 DNA adenine methylase/adenine-specific DNA-methyltransferase [Arthrobacter oryzae]
MVRATIYPRLRYMGSKYKLAPTLAGVFSELGGESLLDAFSGSGFVGYLAKSMGYAVTSNDYLHFPSVISSAVMVNDSVVLSDELIAKITGPAADDRDFIRRTFKDVFFTDDDRAFLDSAWSHIASLDGFERDIALSALILSAARKQPRGVFTISGDLENYNDGRRDLRISLREHFRERVAEYNQAVFASAKPAQALTGDVFDLEKTDYDVVYLDPPYAPPSDDADYTKRYHFLEGLSDYWIGREIMHETKTKKIPKKHSLFASRFSIEDALERTFDKFKDAGAIVMSYSSNAVPDDARIKELLGAVKPNVEIRQISHQYHFGTHTTATRRAAQEYIFIGRD